jgi:hypothetical protein
MTIYHGGAFNAPVMSELGATASRKPEISMRFLSVLGFVLCVGSASNAIAADDCMQTGKTDEMQQGRLVQKTIGGERVYILQIPTPQCLTGDAPTDKVKGTTTVQITSSDAKVSKLIAKFAGKDVQVIGRPFAATPKHKAPIVMDLNDIDEI